MNNKEINKYIDYLKDIKIRVDFTHKLLTQNIKKQPLVLVAENASLQIRIILELIALSSIVANKEEYSKLRKSFATDWNGKKIIEGIEKVNPDFYPKPSKQIINPSTQKVERIIEIKENVLNKESYIEAYNFVSNYLHAHNLYSPPIQYDEVIEKLREYISQIYTSLSHFTIQLPDSDKQLWVVMNTKGGEIQVTEMQKI
jgi:hypothetical protein